MADQRIIIAQLTNELDQVRNANQQLQMQLRQLDAANMSLQRVDHFTRICAAIIASGCPLTEVVSETSLMQERIGNHFTQKAEEERARMTAEALSDGEAEKPETQDDSVTPFPSKTPDESSSEDASTDSQ